MFAKKLITRVCLIFNYQLLTSLLIISRNRTRITMWIALKASKTNIMACA